MSQREQHSEDAEGRPGEPESRESLQPAQVTQIAEQLWMAVRSGPVRDAFLDKIGGDHIHKLIDSSVDQEKRNSWFGFILAIVVLVAVFALCWLFLSYGEGDKVGEIIALIIGLAGGYGLGRVHQRSQQE